MTDEMMTEESPISAPSAAIDRELVLTLNFVPAWARQPPSATSFFRERPDRGERGAPRDRDGQDRRPDRRDRRDQRPDRRAGGGGGGAPGRGRGHRPVDGDFGHGHADGRRGYGLPQREAPLPLNIRFLPEERQLAALVKRIRATKRAYPFAQIVSLFLENPRACRVRLECTTAEQRLFQCTSCGMLSLTRPALENHLVREHMGDAFAIEETEGEAPSGNFVCVARCGLSGTLLGPPNHNSYNERVEELYRTGYTHMTMAEFRRNIETLHDASLIEEWKQSARKHRLYRPKESPADAAPLRWPAAADLFLKQHAAAMVKTAATASLSADLAHRTGDTRLTQAFDAAWNRECRAPRSLPIAIQGALRGRHLHLFRPGGGERYVTFVEPVPLDPDRAIPSIREVLLCLRAKPGCSRAQLVAELRPGVAADGPEAAAILAPLAWLIERGHIIEFHDGTLAVPLAG